MAVVAPLSNVVRDVRHNHARYSRQGLGIAVRAGTVKRDCPLGIRNRTAHRHSPRYIRTELRAVGAQIGITKRPWAEGLAGVVGSRSNAQRAPLARSPLDEGRIPTKREPEMSFGPTRVSVSLLRCRILWPHRLAPNTAPGAPEPLAVSGPTKDLLTQCVTPRVKGLEARRGVSCCLRPGGAGLRQICSLSPVSPYLRTSSTTEISLEDTCRWESFLTVKVSSIKLSRT